MGKLKATLQTKQMSALKNTQSILKKRKKKKDHRRPLNSTHKHHSKILHQFHKISEDVLTTISNVKERKKHDSTNILATEDAKRPNLIRYSKNDKKTTKVLKKIQTNTNDKTKHKGRKRKWKENTITIQTNDNIAEADAPATRKNKKLQISAEKTTDFKQNKKKIRNSKINQKTRQSLTKAEEQQTKSEKILKLNNYEIKMKRLKEMLIDKAQAKTAQKSKKKQSEVAQLTLRDRMMAQLRASRFRFINETLYSNTSWQSKQYFKEEPDAFTAYHEGYKQQLEQWLVNPLDIIISSIKKMPMDYVIADFGCGEAQLAASVPHKVHSFDFIALNDTVKACDMAHTPLLMNSINVVVFCLSLMGTNLNDYLMEANRVLKNNGIVKIVEVESRFENLKDFIKLLGHYGFKNTWKDLTHDLFYFMDFKKEEDISMKKKNLPSIILKPCLYKKR